MRHHDDRRPASVHLFDEVEHLARHQRIEISGRLVRQEQARLAREGAGDGHALLLPSGKLCREVAHARAETHLLQRRFDAALALGGGKTPVAQRHVDVVEEVQVGNQIETLEDKADLLIAQARALVVGQAADLLAVEHVLTTARRLEQTGDVQERRFARTRGTGHGHEFAGAHLHREIAQGVRLDEIGLVDPADVLH